MKWSQQYVTILEVNLVFHNGMTLPLFSEFLSYAKGDTDTTRQDCELKVFKRLAVKIKQEFPPLPLIILLDGLNANGPVFDLCIEYGWDSIIVLKDKCLPSVWEEFQALENHDHFLIRIFGGSANKQ